MHLLSRTWAIWVYRSDDNGQTWNSLETETPGDPRRELTTGGSDKEFIHVDKHCNSPYKDNVYLTWHDGNVMQFSRSTDFGNTWDPNTSFNADPTGIGSDIVTDASGAIYYVYPATQTREILLKKSTDGGVSFPAGTTLISNTLDGFDFPIPVMPSRRVFIYASVDADLSSSPYSGSIYAAWTDNNGPGSFTPANNHARIQVAYSRDQGATWTVVTPHETADILTVDRFHQWLAVDVKGNVHVVFYDTRNSANRDGVDLYHSMSIDGAQTFSAPQRLTSETSPPILNSFEWGDYNGLDHVVRQSTVFTDNRQEGGGGGDSEDIYSTTELQGGMNISMAPDAPISIFGPTTVCPGQDIPLQVSDALGAETYQWSFSGTGTIIGNGNSSITIEGITAAGGTVSVLAQNVCGSSSSIMKSFTMASPGVCAVSNCVLNNLTITDANIGDSDIFDIIQVIDSDATVLAGESKVFRAGGSIEVPNSTEFIVENSSYFIAQIEDCSAALKGGK